MKQETVTIKEASSEITSSAESEKVAVVDLVNYAKTLTQSEVRKLLDSMGDKLTEVQNAYYRVASVYTNCQYRKTKEA